MKIKLTDIQELWSAVEKVKSATPRRSFPNEVCLETTDDGLAIHRYAESTYAEITIPAEVMEEGKVIVGNIDPVQWLRGEMTLEVEGTDLLLGNTKLRLSSADLFLYSRMGHNCPVVEVTIDPAKILYTTEDNKETYSWVVIDGSDMICTDTINIAIATNENQIIDGSITVPRDVLKIARKGTFVGLEGKKIWVFDDAFRYYSTLIEKPFPAGYFRKGITDKISLENPQVKLNQKELTQALQLVISVSRDLVWRDGMAAFILTNGQLIIDSYQSETGKVNLTLDPVASHGTFDVSCFPKSILNAATCDSVDEVVIEGWFHPDHKRWAFLVHCGSVVSFIPSTGDGWREK